MKMKLVPLILFFLLLASFVGTETVPYSACRTPYRTVKMQEIYKGQQIQLCKQVLVIPTGEIHFDVIGWPDHIEITTREIIEDVRMCGNHQCAIIIYKTLSRSFKLQKGDREFYEDNVTYFDINNDYVFRVDEVGYGYIIFTRL